jgi:hypothetical protein
MYCVHGFSKQITGPAEAVVILLSGRGGGGWCPIIQQSGLTLAGMTYDWNLRLNEDKIGILNVRDPLELGEDVA